MPKVHKRWPEQTSFVHEHWHEREHTAKERCRGSLCQALLPRALIGVQRLLVKVRAGLYRQCALWCCFANVVTFFAL